MKRLCCWAFALLFLAGCKTPFKHDFYYEESYCANPWDEQDQNMTDDQYKEVICNYLEDKLDIKVSDVELSNEGTPESCYACTCKSGRWIRLKSAAKFEQELMEAGFKVD